MHAHVLGEPHGTAHGRKGQGTLSYATKIRACNNTNELENFNTSPVMLTQIEARPHCD